MTYPNISSMQWLNARDVLPGEATHFTPWLADNLDLLADAADLSELTQVDTEVAVAEKRLDILASGIDGDGDVIPVIIENQYGVTDHRHLGQVITYLAQQQHGLAAARASGVSESRSTPRSAAWPSGSRRSSAKRTLLPSTSSTEPRSRASATSWCGCGSHTRSTATKSTLKWCLGRTRSSKSPAGRTLPG